MRTETSLFSAKDALHSFPETSSSLLLLLIGIGARDNAALSINLIILSLNLLVAYVCTLLNMSLGNEYLTIMFDA